jgi:cytochrome c peroxidase
VSRREPSPESDGSTAAPSRVARAGSWCALGALSALAVLSLVNHRPVRPSAPATEPVPLLASASALAKLSLAAQVGKNLFFDRSLSASGEMSCATCHDPAHAYGPPNDLAVQLGGARRVAAGTRAVPSLRYLEYTPPYADALENPDGVSEPGPGGGFTFDGRAANLAEQAQIPLLAENEMANESPASVVAKLRRAPYAELFRRAFGAGIFAVEGVAFRRALDALRAFQLEDESFHPYSSKFDRFATNKIGGELSAAERRGLEVYSDPKKGNCFACHYSGPGIGGSMALFTDFSYANLGVPRNSEIPANREPEHFDLGICGRADHPLPSSARLCGLFKTPTLRNVASRKVFFHNGEMTSLRAVLRFYNTRDTNPERWYPVVDGAVRKFDDLPLAYRKNIDRQPPLEGRPPGAKPAMTEQDLDDLEAFLGTLTDDDVVSSAPAPLARVAPSRGE